MSRNHPKTSSPTPSPIIRGTTLYRLAAGGSIEGMNGSVLSRTSHRGTYTRDEIISLGVNPQNFAEYVNTGYLLRADADQDFSRSVIPGVDVLPVNLEVDLVPPRNPDTIRVANPQKPPGTASRWAFDPATLRDYSLDQLNASIAERDESVPPFETESEARAFLSADFPN